MYTEKDLSLAVQNVTNTFVNHTTAMAHLAVVQASLSGGSGTGEPSSGGSGTGEPSSGGSGTGGAAPKKAATKKAATKKAATKKAATKKAAPKKSQVDDDDLMGQVLEEELKGAPPVTMSEFKKAFAALTGEYGVDKVRDAGRTYLEKNSLPPMPEQTDEERGEVLAFLKMSFNAPEEEDHCDEDDGLGF